MGLGKLRKALKTGMGGSSSGRGRTEDTKTMKDYSDKLRREQGRIEIANQLEDFVPAWGPKTIEFRECTCGSGAHWANCMEGSPYCG